MKKKKSSLGVSEANMSRALGVVLGFIDNWFD